MNRGDSYGPQGDSGEAADRQLSLTDFLFPKDLQQTHVALTNIILIGSCLAQDYADRFRKIDPDLNIFYIPSNNIQALPPAETEALDTYQLQYIQLPVRTLLTDRVIRIFDVDRNEGLGSVLEEAKDRLAAMLDAAMQYNKQSGIITIISNFLVPQGFAAHSLADQHSEHDLNWLITQLNSHLAECSRRYTNAFVADINGVGNSLGKRFFLDDVISFYAHGITLPEQCSIAENFPSWSAPNPARIEQVPEIDTIYELRIDDFYRAVFAQIQYIYRIAKQFDPVKIVIFDLDNTLWRGLIAEHYAVAGEQPDYHGWPVGIWETIHHLRRRGIAVSICSKNDEEIVRGRWTRAVGLPWLQYEDFVAPRVNWVRKSVNIKSILEELGLTARSAVFVDDNPVEREEVTTALPGIRAIGGDPYQTRRILLWAAETQRSVISAETRNRETSYRAIINRKVEAATKSRNEFLTDLNLKIVMWQVSDDDPDTLARVIELTNKTNQFNTTGLKWTLSELRGFLKEGGWLFAFKVADKFSNYGLVGAMYLSRGILRQFVMSCRVLGMDVEIEVLRRLTKRYLELNSGGMLCGAIIEAETNVPCRDVFVRAGFEQSQREGVYTIRQLTCENESHMAFSWADQPPGTSP